MGRSKNSVLTPGGTSAKMGKRVETVSEIEMGITMRRTAGIGMLFTLALFLCACGNKQLSAKKTQENTLYIRGDGSVQVAVLEEFDRGYYDIEEAGDFVKKAVKDYNDANGEDSVVLDSLTYSRSDENKACMVMTYKDIATYDDLVGAKIRELSIQEAVKEGLLPEEMTSLKGSKTVQGEDVGKEDERYRVLVLTAKFHVMVEGRIKYYTNAVVLNNSEVQTKGKKQQAVVVYRR